MKKAKRLLALFLTAVICFSLLPARTLAAETQTASGANSSQETQTSSVTGSSPQTQSVAVPIVTVKITAGNGEGILRADINTV